jgi:hypothetical protein
MSERDWRLFFRDIRPEIRKPTVERNSMSGLSGSIPRLPGFGGAYSMVTGIKISLRRMNQIVNGGL